MEAARQGQALVEVENASVWFTAPRDRAPRASSGPLDAPAHSPDPSMVEASRVGGRTRLSQTFWGRRRTDIQALQDVSVTIRAGERVALIGHNGSGKTTLLRVMGGQLQPQTGRAHRAGACLSMLSATVTLDRDLSGWRNIAYFAQLMGVAREARGALTDDVAAFTALGPFLDAPVRTYSAGMTMRLAFGLYTSVSTDLLLIDEVMGAGDAAFQKKAAARIARRIAQSGALVLATHSRGVAKIHCPRTVLLQQGEVVFDGPTDDAWDRYDALRLISG